MTVKESAGFSRDEIVQHLEANGIQTRMLFAGNLTKHPCFDEMRQTGVGYRIAGDLRVTDLVMRNTFWVGVYPGLGKKEVEIIIVALKSFAEERCK